MSHCLHDSLADLDRYIHDSQAVVQQSLRVERFVAYETESLSGTFGVWRRLLHDWGRVRIHLQSQRQPLS